MLWWLSGKHHLKVKGLKNNLQIIVLTYHNFFSYDNTIGSLVESKSQTSIYL